MTKDQTIAYLMDRLAKAEAELDRIREAARVRQSRHRTPHGHVTVTLPSGSPTRESDPSSSSLGNGELRDPKDEVGKTVSGSSRHGHVTWDHERAESDAAQKGLVGAAFEAELQRFTDYWDSAGWRRKNGPVRDRNATWRSWLDQPYRGNGNGSKPHYLDGLEEWNRRMDEAEVVQ